MRGIIGVIVACIALVCGFSYYGESAGHKNSDPSWGNTEEEQYLADSDYDEEGTYDEETSYSEEEEDTDDGMSLNDIRFADFDDDDWLDNEYIWALRQYLDDIDVSKIKDESLKPYLKVIKGKFVIARVEPALMGGLFIMFSFIDKPEGIFSTWVYSDVNEATGEVSNYTVNGIKLEDIKNDMSREEILKIMKEHPELKLF